MTSEGRVCLGLADVNRYGVSYFGRSERSIKVMSTIVPHSPLNILETVRDSGLVPKKHQ